MLPDFKLNLGRLSNQCQLINIHSFHDLIRFVWALPYQRNTDFASLTTNQYGTCSAKHAFITEVAHENEHHEIVFECGIFEINANNMPQVKHVIADYEFDSFLEAHCYIRFAEKVYDYTFSIGQTLIASDKYVKGSIPKFAYEKPLAIKTFLPMNWTDKVSWHKEVMDSWCLDNGHDSNRMWQMREACISALESR